MNCLFLSGEIATTLNMCALRDGWTHTTTARRMTLDRDKLRYGKLPRDFDAVLWYCSVDDDELRQNNEEILIRSGIPCWPDPRQLQKWGDRRTKLAAAVEAGLVSGVEFRTRDMVKEVFSSRDLVVKVGNLHVGEGKLLVCQGEIFPNWDGIASIEPFVVGTSVRVYVVDGCDEVFCVAYDNPDSWIKNGPGADTRECDGELPLDLLEHARKVHALHGLPVSGNDYILAEDGTWRFLEHNHFPGVTLHGGVEKVICSKFLEVMKNLEKDVLK